MSVGTQVRTLQQFIGGEFVDSASSETLDNLEPATGELLSRIPRGDAADIDRAVSAAWEAAPAWGALPALERAQWLIRLAEAIEARFAEFATLEARDAGKPIGAAKSLDIPRAIANFRFFAAAILHTESGFHPMTGALNYTLRKPIGVAGLISPWNLPLYLLTWKIAPCLAAGSCAVAKPSELTPMTANLLAEVAAEIGLPPGVLNIVQGAGPVVGQALTEHPRVRAISFTGGTATGRRVAAAAAPRFAKLSLELGGKNPNLIFADCNFEAMLDTTVRSSFANAGQICLCGSRLFIERSIYERTVEALVARANALVIGDPLDPRTQLGALISAAHREKVEGYLRLAQEEGGTLLCGGDRPNRPGYFLRPAVIADLAPSSRTMQEEIFGPVVTVTPFDTEDEALALANGTGYGLSATLWTEQLTRAHRLAALLETGMVWINTWLLRDLRVPFGGVKESGIGREGGEHSLDFFSETVNVCVKL